jgi:hypothetical protein
VIDTPPSKAAAKNVARPVETTRRGPDAAFENGGGAAAEVLGNLALAARH